MASVAVAVPTNSETAQEPEQSETGEEATRSSDPEPEPEAKSISDFLLARYSLFQKELTEAAAEIRKRAVLVLFALSGCVLAFGLGVTGAVALLARLTDVPWEYAALAVSAIISLLSWLALRRVKSSLRAHLFPETLNEFERDCEWLESKKEKAKPRS